MENFTHHELKVIYTAVRKYQKSTLGNYFLDPEYYELGQILDKLQPIAYSETYLENERV